MRCTVTYKIKKSFVLAWTIIMSIKMPRLLLIIFNIHIYLSISFWYSIKNTLHNSVIFFCLVICFYFIFLLLIIIMIIIIKKWINKSECIWRKFQQKRSILIVIFGWFNELPRKRKNFFAKNVNKSFLKISNIVLHTYMDGKTLPTKCVIN